MGTLVLEIDDERIPKERPPKIDPIPAGRCGNILIEQLAPVSRFQIFGKTRIMVPRGVTMMSRVLDTDKRDFVLSTGQREELTLVPIASDHPEEVYRYFNHARLVHGKVLVIGIGLGLFPRLAMHAKELVILSLDEAIYKLMESSLLASPWKQELTLAEGLEKHPPEEFAEKLKHTLECYQSVRFDWAFVDPNPYLGYGFLATKYLALPEVNAYVKAIHDAKVMRPGGQIMVRGYLQMIKDWQLKCQKLSHEALEILEPFMDTVNRIRHPMDQKFVNWALKNKRRVLGRRDYKFINAWARSSAHEF